MAELNRLHERIIEISREHKLPHLGSNLTSVDIIEEIYNIKKPEERFILSCGHAAVALYVVLEKHGYGNAETMYLQHGSHPERCGTCHIDCSTGSLGMGISIALGMAMADRAENVYCLISDGEATEGAVYEVANLMRKYNVTNLRVWMNYNGYSAYDVTDKTMIDNLQQIMPSIVIVPTNVEDYGLSGLSAHYIIP